MFHTYIDWTDDEKPFYVGMGDDTRIARLLGRNKHHTFVDDPSYNGVGCNYTLGGEGCVCSNETKQKISDAIRAQYASGRTPWNKGEQVKYVLTDKDRQSRRDKLIAFNKTRPMLGKNHSEEAKARMRKPHVCSICRTPGHTKTRCPQRPANAVNRVAESQRQRRYRS